MSSSAPRRFSLVFGGGALLWGGFLAGVSMLATPVKFTAPSLALPVALDVGRVTFAALSRIEIVLALLLVLLALTLARSLWNVVGALLLAALIAAQVLWLLPELDARVQIIMDGGTPPESGMHVLYIVVEAVKLLLLVGLGVLNLWQARR